MFNKKKVIAAFTAGCFGGIIVNADQYLVGFLNLPKIIGLGIVPDFNMIDLLSDVMWGGVWGLLFAVPFLDNMLTLKGVLLGGFSFLLQLLTAVSYVHEHVITINDPVALIAYLFGLNVYWGVISSVCWNSWKDLAKG